MPRPSIYSDEVAEIICERLAAGESLVTVCKRKDMPGLRTVTRWAAENQAFGAEYARAREAQAEVMDHKIMTTAAEASKDPAGARVKIGAYQWRAAKLAPKRYSDRQILAGDPEAPLIPAPIDDAARVGTLLGILAAADARRRYAFREGLTPPFSGEQIEYLDGLRNPSPACATSAIDATARELPPPDYSDLV